MKEISLNGEWKLWYQDYGSIKPDVHVKDWIKASVPGEVHLDLIRAGKIPEPLLKRNYEKLQWVEEKEWWYYREFTLPKFSGNDKKIELTFEGLDTTATIWVNNKIVGKHNNAFISVTFDITNFIIPGNNTIFVRLDCGLRSATNKPLKKYFQIRGKGERIWIRKPQFSFGWDWAQRLLNCGIWRPVYVRIYNQIVIRDVHIQSDIKGDVAYVHAIAEVENFSFNPILCSFSFSLQHKDQKISCVLSKRVNSGIHKVSTTLKVENPALWNPHNVGMPNLYNFRLEIVDDTNTKESYCTKFGIRKIELIQDKLPNGKTFYFRINGRKTFCQGANWVPADSILARVTKDKYRRLVEEAYKMGLNMFRVWGGGIYEDEYFYNLCDEYGIMIWQDFMFACSMYPGNDPGFCNEIRRESEIVVKRLRNHPSILLWCGGNEQERPDIWYKLSDRFYGERIWKGILPEVCKSLDPDRTYRSCSPTGGSYPRSEFEGDSHNFLPGATTFEKFDYKNARKDVSRFASEFYYMTSCPQLKTVQEYMMTKDISRKSKDWLAHLNSMYNYTDDCLRIFYKCPERLNINEYINSSQILQGEALKFMIENLRRKQYNCGGCMFWMYNDCWPTVGWTVIDYYLRKKATYYYVKRAFRPVILVFKEEEGGLSIWLVNNTDTVLRGILKFGHYKFYGEPLEESTLKVMIKPNSSQQVARVYTTLTYIWNCIGSFYWAKFIDGENNKIICENRYLFTSFRGLSLQDLKIKKLFIGAKDSIKKIVIPDVKLEKKIKQLNRNMYELTMKTPALALAVEIKMPEGVECSDNYFDIFPNESKKIILTGNNINENNIKINALNRYLSEKNN